jgi:caa(3)-type oxidase subunit IV
MSHADHFDAHGHKDHGHVIVSQWTLRAVLAALLFFTLLTVGLSLAENWLAHVFHIELPGWVNVAVALAIAAVKTVIVVSYFMQLKYDNPLNTMVLVFTVLTVMFFLGFTVLDLGQRGTLDRNKARYVIEGGSGLTGKAADGSVSAGIANTPITEASRIVARNAGTYDPHHSGGHHDDADRGPKQSITDAGFSSERPAAGSSSMVSRPIKGVTIPGLPGYRALSEDGKHSDHADAPAHDAAKPTEAKPSEAKPIEAKTSEKH